MDNLLRISSSPMVTVCDRMLMTRKSPSLRSNNCLQVPVAKDDESLSFVPASGVWRRMPSHASFYRGVRYTTIIAVHVTPL